MAALQRSLTRAYWATLRAGHDALVAERAKRIFERAERFLLRLHHEMDLRTRNRAQ